MKNLTKEQIADELIHYSANMRHPLLKELLEDDVVSNRISSELIDFENEWNNALCDDGGPTAEQDAEFDRILDKYATRILELIE